MEIYKIRNKEGLYWEGHGLNRFTAKGKTWKQINHVKLAIRNVCGFPIIIGKSYSECLDYNNKIIPDYL